MNTEYSIKQHHVAALFKFLDTNKYYILNPVIAGSQRKKTVTTFYLVRHEETLLNSLGRTQGWSDSSLTDNRKRTAAELGAQLNRITFNAAYASGRSNRNRI